MSPSAPTWSMATYEVPGKVSAPSLEVCFPAFDSQSCGARSSENRLSFARVMRPSVRLRRMSRTSYSGVDAIRRSVSKKGARPTDGVRGSAASLPAHRRFRWKGRRGKYGFRYQASSTTTQERVLTAMLSDSTRDSSCSSTSAIKPCVWEGTLWMYHESNGRPAINFEVSVRLMKSSPGMTSWFASGPVWRKEELCAVGTVRNARLWSG